MITTHVLNESDVDLASVNIYDPNNPTLIPKFVVQCDTPQGQVGFLCRQVEINRILLSLPEKISLALQNFTSRDEEELDDERDLTPEDLSRARYLHEYNVAAVKLGVVEPVLTEEQVRDLPTTVIRDIADAVTDADTTTDETTD